MSAPSDVTGADVSAALIRFMDAYEATPPGQAVTIPHADALLVLRTLKTLLRQEARRLGHMPR